MSVEIKEMGDGSGNPFHLFWWIMRSILLPISIPWLIFRFIKNGKVKKRRAELQDKVVVITGASSGIGEAIAHSFYAQGCRLVLASRRVEELNRVKADLMQTKPPVSTHVPVVVQMDLSDLDSLPKHVDKIMETFGQIDILINNGGISYRGYAATTKVDVDIKVMVVNYFAQIALTKAVIKNMIQRKCGHLVYMSSMQGKLPLPYRTSYGSSKQAIQSFCDTLRCEVYKHNIKVTVISPTYVNTSLSLNAITGSGKVYGEMDRRTKAGLSPEVVAQRTLDAVVMGEKDVMIAPLIQKYAVVIRNIFPALYFRIMLIYEKTCIPKKD